MDYNLAVHWNPHDEEAYNNRGVTWHNMEYFERALADYTSALLLKADYERFASPPDP